MGRTKGLIQVFIVGRWGGGKGVGGKKRDLREAVCRRSRGTSFGVHSS